METQKLKCTCTHEFQDKMYGKGMRVHNFAPKATAKGGWRCTVCKTVKQGSEIKTTNEEE